MEFLQLEKATKVSDIETIIHCFNLNELNNEDPIQIYGTIHRIKKMSGFSFINIRTPKRIIQCILEDNIPNCDIKDYSLEECVLIDGIIVKEKRSVIGFDIQIRKMTRVSGEVEQLPIEISNDKKIENLNINTLLDNRILSLRNPKVRAIMKICDGILYAFRNFLRMEGFTEFIPPRIVQEGAEGGSDLFKIDYFGQKAFLNQSPQMYKQIMVGVFTKVFTVGPVFRAEKFSTTRHINEFQGLDMEMGFIDSFEDLMVLEAKMFQYIYHILNSEYAMELEMFLGKGNLLPEIKLFPKIKFLEAKQLFADSHPGKDGESILHEPDFSPEEERWIGEYFNKKYHSPMVFITHYPSIKRPFYTMDDPKDSKYTLSFDMLLNGLEVTTGGQRIHDYKEQVEKMKDRGMNIEDFKDYLTMHKYGMPPHGGMGLGMERIVQNILGLDNIKLATAFPRDRDRLRP